MPTRRRGTRKLRELDVLELLFERSGGVTSEDVADVFDVSRSTAWRVLQLVEGSRLGVRMEQEGRRRRYFAPTLRGRLSVEQRWALGVTRELLVGLNGSSVVDALDRVLDDEAGGPPLSVEAPVGAEDPEVASVLYEAAGRRRRVRATYQGEQDVQARERYLEVHDLRLRGGAWYATVTDLDDDAQSKTFKVVRVSAARLLDEPATHRVNVDALYAHSVGVWDAALVDVAVQLDGPAARQAREYPLNITQSVEQQGDVVVVRARVAGLVEVARWVWRWGRHAQVLEPPELVASVAAELKAAAARYR